MDFLDEDRARTRRVRARARDARTEWMALMTPGWRPDPLTAEDARAFMRRG